MKWRLVMVFMFVLNVCHQQMVFAEQQANKTVAISSTPQGAGVFHYLRGESHFLGYTPLKLNQEQLANKLNTRILLSRPGYDHQLFDLSLNDKKRHYRLKAVARPYLSSDSATGSILAGCRKQIEQRLGRMVKRGYKSQIGVNLPARWVENQAGSKLVLMTQLFNHKDIKIIKKQSRRDKDVAIDMVKDLLEPLRQYLFQQFQGLTCLNSLLIITAYQDKGMNIDFTPYKAYWIGRSEYTIGNTRYITTAVGSTIELKKNMVVSKKSKSFMFEYKLNP